MDVDEDGGSKARAVARSTGKSARSGGGDQAEAETIAMLAAAVESAEEAVAGDEFSLAEVSEEGISMEQEMALSALEDEDHDAPEKPPKRHHGWPRWLGHRSHPGATSRKKNPPSWLCSITHV